MASFKIANEIEQIPRPLGVLSDDLEGTYWRDHDTTEVERIGQRHNFCQFYIDNLDIFQTFKCLSQ